eukprot:3118216-Rhodomonas_salina.2
MATWASSAKRCEPNLINLSRPAKAALGARLLTFGARRAHGVQRIRPAARGRDHHPRHGGVRLMSGLRLASCALARCRRCPTGCLMSSTLVPAVQTWCCPVARGYLSSPHRAGSPSANAIQ